MTPGERWAAALAGLDPGWSVVRGGADGAPLDEQGSLRLVGPAPAEVVDALTSTLQAVRDDLDAAVVLAGVPGDGETVLPTALGGEPAWGRACAAAAAGIGDPCAVVEVRCDEPAEPDRRVLRAASALARSVRDRDVVCRVDGGFRVLALRCREPEAGEIADRLGAALLDVGVGAVTAAGVDTDPLVAAGRAAAAADGTTRTVWRL